MKLLRSAGLSILLAGNMFSARHSWADSWQNVFSTRVSTEFDSNPAMSPAYPGGVWRALLEPGYSLLGRVGENDLKAGLGVQLVRSSNKVLDPDRNNPTAFFDWLRHYDGGEYGISSRFAELATRDSGVDATGRVPASSTRASRALSGTWSDRLSVRSTLAAEGSYEEVTYKGGNYVDYSIKSGGFKFSYALLETVTPFLRASGVEYVPADGGASSSLANATLGLNGKTEYTEWMLQAGGAKAGDAKAITEGSVAARFAGRRTELTLNAGRSVSPSGLGGFVKADQAGGSWRYALSEYSDAGIDVEARRNLPITIIGDRTSGSTSGVWIDHDFSPLWKMRMYYRHWINQVNGGGSIASNIVGLTLAYHNANSPTLTQGHDHD